MRKDEAGVSFFMYIEGHRVPASLVAHMADIPLLLCVTFGATSRAIGSRFVCMLAVGERLLWRSLSGFGGRLLLLRLASARATFGSPTTAALPVGASFRRGTTATATAAAASTSGTGRRQLICARLGLFQRGHGKANLFLGSSLWQRRSRWLILAEKALGAEKIARKYQRGGVRYVLFRKLKRKD